MALWACRGCTTAYAVGIPACPHCGSTDYEEDGVSKVNAEGVATHYLAEGAAVPDDLPEGVRLVGPGAPVPDTAAEGTGDAHAPSVVAEDGPERVPAGEPGAGQFAHADPTPGEPADTHGLDSTPQPRSAKSSAQGENS